MGIYYNPRPVNAGLIFAYDMANTMKSWKGKPTVNTCSFGTYEYGYNSTKISNAVPPVPPPILGYPIYKITSNNGSDSQQILYTASVDQVNGGTYTHSAYVFLESGSWVSVGQHWNPWDYGTPQYIEQRKWIRIEDPVTNDPNNYGAVALSYNTNGAVYITASQYEIGSYATPFVGGTRSATQAILDFTNNRTITASDLTYNSDNTFTFDGINDVILTDFPAQTLQTSTLEAVVYDTKNNGSYRSIIQINTNSDDALYINPSNNLMFWPAPASSLQVPANQWNYVCAAYNGSSILYCVNGEFQEIAGASLDFTNYQFLRIGAHSTSDAERFKGQIPIARVYNRALTRSEMLQNYSAFRGRFGI